MSQAVAYPQEHQELAEKKNRFQISREVQEEFVNGVAQTMLSLAETAGKWQKPWAGNAPMGMPYCPMTGREYGGANMVRLMLTSIVNGYNEDRWMTFKQLQQFQGNHPELEMKIRKGAKGVKLLRPVEITFIVKEDGKWEFLSDKRIKELTALKEQGEEVPDVQRMTLFYPFTVFNASQVEGFPQKEGQTKGMTEIERNEFVERFIACSGVPVEHHNGDAYYQPDVDLVKMPFPENFNGTEEYYAAKLHEVYHATGHSAREHRKEKQGSTLKTYAFEEMRAEMFSMLAGAKFKLPMPESNSAAYISHWNKTFSSGDAKAVFQAAGEAAKVLTIMHQFEAGEQPNAKWFPRSEAWPELIALQTQRDETTGSSLHKTHEQILAPTGPLARPELISFDDAVVAFKGTDNQSVQVRSILQNPEFLELALKQDPKATRDLADLLGSLGQTLHMELDEKMRGESAAHTAPQPEQPAVRMRS